MHTPKLHSIHISFVIPTYNYSFFLRKCLKSICDQNYRSYEIIIVDDGSTDNTKEMVMEFTEKYSEIRFKYLYQNNSGPSAARNHGSNMAEGEYIWYIDSDDVLLEGAISHMAGALEENPDAGLIFSGYRSVNETGEIKNHHADPIKGDRASGFKKYIFKKMSGLTTGSALIHHRVFQDVSFPEGAHNNEDIVFFSHVLALYPTVSVPGIILEKFRHKNSLRKDIERIKETGLSIVDSLFNKEILEPEIMIFRKKFHALRCLSIFRSFYLADDYGEAVKYYREAIRIWPKLAFKWAYLRKYLKAIQKKKSSK